MTDAMNTWTRTVKSVSTLNVATAILIVLGYAVYGIAVGMPVDQRFLGKNPDWFGNLSSPQVSPWSLILMLEAIVVMAFLYLRYFESDMKPHRFLCVFVGVVGLWEPFLSYLSPYTEELVLPGVPPWDTALSWYVWCSHLAYALTGPPDTLMRE